MQPATAYSLRLTSESPVGSSLPSIPALVTTLADVPEKPTSPRIVLVEQTSLTLSWSKPRSNGAMITVYRSNTCDVESSSCITTDHPPGSGQINTTILSLPSARNYTITLEAINSMGSSGTLSVPGVHTTRAVPMQGYPLSLNDPLPGLSRKTTLRVVWWAPYDNGLPITSYVLTVEIHKYVTLKQVDHLQQ